MMKRSTIERLAIVGLAVALALSLKPGPAAARDGAASRPLIGVCDVWTIAYELSISEKHRGEDDRLKAERDRVTKPLRDELKALSDKIDEMHSDGVNPEGNDELRGLMDKYYELDAELDEKMEEFSAQRETVFAQRLRESCEEVCEAAQRVAEERGFDYILSSRDLKAEKHVRDIVKERRAEDQDKDDDEGDEEAEQDRLTFNDVYYSERFRIVAAGPENIRVDDLIRDRLGLPGVGGN